MEQTLVNTERYKSIKTVRDLLESSAKIFGKKPFIKYLDADNIIEKDFITLKENSLAISRYFRSICPERMHIAIIGKTSYEYITALTGILISGNVAVPFAPSTSVDEACELFCDGDIDVLFYEDEYQQKAEEIAKRYSNLKLMINMGEKEKFSEIYRKYNSDSEFSSLSEIDIDPEECVLIVYTSGTTGVRKGVMLSSKNLISNVTYTELTLYDDDVYLSVLPMHHIFCFSCDYLKPLLDGLTVCLNGDIANIGKNLAVFQPTTMRLVPMICESLIRKVQLVNKKYPDLSNRQAAEKVFGKNIRWIAVGGANLGKGLVAEYEKYGIMLRQGYGMSEVSPKISTADFGNQYKDSSGKILRSICDVRIVDGEIQIKGESVMLGYYKKPEETEKVFTDDGYLKTGDLGYITETNHIYVTGRLKNLIILSNGENISPEELEKKFYDEKVIKEIVVSADGDKIIAEIYPDADTAAEKGIDNIEEYLNAVIKEANKGDKPEREIAALKIRETPFEKTTTGKIKRSAVRFDK